MAGLALLSGVSTVQTIRLARLQSALGRVYDSLGLYDQALPLGPFRWGACLTPRPPSSAARCER